MPPAKKAKPQGLTVAVTGPTGDIGVPFVSALERSRAVKRIVGMARRPFDPAARGWRKTEYRQGDVLQRDSVDELVAGADVVVHLAFLIMGGHDETREINLRGSRNVFEAARDARKVKRLVYASSVAAYGFHDDPDRPDLFTEDVAPRGTEDFYYSAQKAELEGMLEEVLGGSNVDAYVFRPCIVAGPNSLLLIENIPYVSIAERLPGPVRRLLDVMPVLRPVIPDGGREFQLVHADDVATAMRAGVLGRGEPGVYNLAAEGLLTFSDVADELGWYAIRVPEAALDATVEVTRRLPFLPPEAEWLQAFRVPVIMDTAKARRQLRWRPQHDGHETLRQTVAAAREEGLLG
ncbi:MAG: NAD-dependent epimerase/dehydratase family protein [Actinomycetota bacterium]|nr:NAD-dependent epimerase/dehydratase family protein [Actinomycetota bacterium]